MAPAILGAVATLAHVPDLVRYGSKPARELERDHGELGPSLAAAQRSYEAAVSYPPHQAFIGNLAPEALWDLQRPWWRTAANGARGEGPFGEVLPAPSFYALLSAVDRFDLVQLAEGFGERARSDLAQHPLLARLAERVSAVSPDRVEAEIGRGGLALFHEGNTVGVVSSAHPVDEALQAGVLLESLTCKATAVMALERLIAQTGIDRDAIEYVVSCGEEAIGDRYQRGGGGLAKAVAEEANLLRATGSDVKAFCCAPVHALVVAAALVEAGVYHDVIVLAGGSLAKLGMKHAGALEHGVPILEDVLGGMAVLISAAAPGEPRLRLDAIGRATVGAGSSQQALYEQLAVAPLQAVGRTLVDVDRYAVELHDPEITEPAGGGDVPHRNYRMLAGLAALRGELPRDRLEEFVRARGLPGFSPTQGHIASAVAFLPHAVTRIRSGELESAMLLAKGSLFLGRLTQQWDGMSVLIEGGDSK